jgi:hypothetical protein
MRSPNIECWYGERRKKKKEKVEEGGGRRRRLVFPKGSQDVIKVVGRSAGKGGADIPVGGGG